MRYGTICSGVEAVSLGWEPLGMQAQFFSEIEPFPKAVLAHHWPNVPDLGDLTQINGRDWAGKLDIFWGSTPCQSMSLAGLRKGVSDPRGALMFHFCRLADEIDPPYVCWENVKGALSDKKNAFGELLGRLAGESEPLNPSGGRWTHAGYVLGPKRNLAWRLFDTQYSGLPQRRERLFLVGCPRDGADPREILFEKIEADEVSAKTRPTRHHYTEAASPSAPRAFSLAIRGRDHGEQFEMGDESANCLLASQGGSDKPFAVIDDGTPHVRMLTPLESERLMGFPDHHTLVPFGKGMASDTVRYKAIGNSIAVTETRWIGEQILKNNS